MSQRITYWITAPLLALGIASNAQAAPICVSPEPTCAVILAGSLAITLLNHEAEARSAEPGAVDAAARPTRIAEELARGEHVHLAKRVREATRDARGFRVILQRHEHGRHDGQQGLSALHASRPDLFADLDRIDSVLARQYPEKTRHRVYGEKQPADARINWTRYAGLARDALALAHAVRTAARESE